MATYFHHHRHHHNHHGDDDDSDIITPQADGMQTFLLMNPSFVGYSDTHPPPPPPPPPLLHAPQLVGVPLHSAAYPPPSNAAWAAQARPTAAERESPRTQQGLSLTLSSHNHSYDAAVSGHHPPPPNGETIHGGSQSPALQRMLMSSKYLKAAQELLDEVVNVNVDGVKPESPKKSKGKREATPAAGGGAEEDKQEVQMKKAKLITLLDEVEQRYRLYHQQMQIIVSSFEEVAGAGSAKTYTSVALKTISNQFRTLRDAIMGQIRASNKSLGVTSGEGEGGSRARLFDQQIRQQRAIQQLGMIQNSAWRPQRGLPEKAVTVLRAWLFEHFLHPYPKDSDKIILAKQTGLTRSQVSNWFINARVRLWKPMIEEMYAEEVKEHQKNGSESKQDQHEEHGSTSATEEKDNAGDNKAKTDNHNSFIPPFTTNTENPSGFTFVGTSRTESDSQGSFKKQRNNEMLQFPDAEKQEECSMMSSTGNGYIGGLGSYPIGQMERFDAGQFPQNFSGNGVSLTLGLPHNETLSLLDTNQDFLHSNQGIDQYRGRLAIGEFNGFGGVKDPNASHSRGEYGAPLLPDFVT